MHGLHDICGMDRVVIRIVAHVSRIYEAEQLEQLNHVQVEVFDQAVGMKQMDAKQLQAITWVKKQRKCINCIDDEHQLIYELGTV
ncbi:jg2439 [Pararge aegeria aegeria]|uniref:Jg2439 protein n=1 Tax=Pararge aegeria aegeria TaxID=348720 RepID=A0A8S4QEY5_9NEOP|nr:jg2439 [Pararge aegeria aegeria]